MSEEFQRKQQEFRELLAGKVLGDLSSEEENLLMVEGSLDRLSDLTAELEEAAAAVQLAFEVNPVSLPEQLRIRIKQRFRESDLQPGNVSTGSDVVGRDVHDVMPAVTGRDTYAATSAQYAAGDIATREQLSADASIQRDGMNSWNRRELFAWIACAASVLIAAAAWFTETAPKTVSLVQAREKLMNESGTIQADWTAGPTPFSNSVAGDVVWNGDQQRGYLRFVGMPRNDPEVEQYQLWIIDPARDAEPIDGGVFDVDSEGEVVIPIDAKLKVIEPQAFAITIEQPGGVVVSTQERLPLLAPID